MSGFAPGAVMGEVLLFSNAAFYGVRMGFDFGAYGETLIQLVQVRFEDRREKKIKEEPKRRVEGS